VELYAIAGNVALLLSQFCKACSYNHCLIFGIVEQKIRYDMIRLTWICIALVVNPNLRRSGMARVLDGSHSFTCTPRVHPQTECIIPAFVFSAEAGTLLPNPGGMKG